MRNIRKIEYYSKNSKFEKFKILESVNVNAIFNANFLGDFQKLKVLCINNYSFCRFGIKMENGEMWKMS